MIGYDLDGVLMNDMKFSEMDLRDQSKIDELILYRKQHFSPLFIPNDDYVIITGRPDKDYHITKSWINENFQSNLPKKLYHFDKNLFDTDSVVKFKSKIINELKLEYYIESDLYQMIRLTVLTDTKIIHFPTFINHNIGKLIK